MKNIQIYNMTIKDFYEIKDILISDFDDFWNLQLLENEIKAENRKYIVAKLENKIVGFAGIMLVKPDIEIMNIVTKKNNRNQGIGSLLLEKIIDIGEKNNFEKIFLEVNEKNIVARKLYEKYGFIEIGLRPKYYSNVDNAIIMSKSVGNFL